MRNLVLFGFMGTGKSLIATKLQKILNLDLWDMDRMIEQKEGKTIDRIFSEEGEEYFRELEKNMSRELSEKSDLIISTGGGVVLNERNIRNLGKNGVCFCLNASPETIFDRVKDETHRPLLQTTNPLDTIRSILESRINHYSKVQFQIDTDEKVPDEICAEILSIFNNYNKK